MRDCVFLHVRERERVCVSCEIQIINNGCDLYCVYLYVNNLYCVVVQAVGMR